MGERQDLPSGSGIDRILKCPGSWGITKAVKAAGVDDVGSAEWRDRGHKIHQALKVALKGGEAPVLDEDEAADAQALLEGGKDAYAEFFRQELEDGHTIEVWYPEERLWYVDKFEKMFSGAWDAGFVCRATNRGLILDYKSGWWHQRAGTWNKQLVSYCVIFRRNIRDIDELGAAIIQRDEYSLARFSGEWLDEQRDEIIEVLREVQTMNPFELGLNPDPQGQCKYCPARLNCPAHHWTLSELSPAAEISAEDAAKLVPVLDDNLLDLLLVRFDQLTVLQKAGQEEAEKRLQQDPDALEHWEYAEGRTTRYFPPLSECQDALASLGVSPGDLAGMMSPALGKLETLLKAKTGLKGKEFTQWWEAHVAPMIQSRTAAKAVRKRRKKKE